MIGQAPFLLNLWDISISCGFTSTSWALASFNTTSFVVSYASLGIPWISKEFFCVYFLGDPGGRTTPQFPPVVRQLIILLHRFIKRCSEASYFDILPSK